MSGLPKKWETSRACAAYPEVNQLEEDTLETFSNLCRRAWAVLKSPHNEYEPVEILPEALAKVFSNSLDVSVAVVNVCWHALRYIIARKVCFGKRVPEDDLIRMYGTSEAGCDYMVPPVTKCIREECKSKLLTDPEYYGARLFTSARGHLPAIAKSLYCRGCSTRYFKDYSAQNASSPMSVRVYYSHEVPEILHVQQYTFVEASLCEHFALSFVNQTSAKKMCMLYNNTTGKSKIPVKSRLGTRLTAPIVLDSFFLHAILRDKHLREEVLTLPHFGDNRSRLRAALEERNYHIVGTGQEMWSHACEVCTKTYETGDGQAYQLSAAVTDGLTLGHPCCNVMDCQVPLSGMKDRYCPIHTRLAAKCIVQGCHTLSEIGYDTCTDASHREYGNLAEARKNTKRYQENERRAARLGEILDPDNAKPSNPPSDKKIKGKGGCREWTHNEQLVVRCCGIIISRATFFGSESVSATADFLKATFPRCFPGSLASYVFYDTSCGLLKYLRAQDDHYFDDCGLPIDVFHFKKGTHIHDDFCQAFCSPYNFPELRDEHGNWLFNTSIAEQINAWFGGFQSIVREMPAYKYAFFLDEMIAIHNRLKVDALAEAGKVPHFIPEEQLRAPRVMMK